MTDIDPKDLPPPLEPIRFCPHCGGKTVLRGKFPRRFPYCGHCVVKFRVVLAASRIKLWRKFRLESGN